MKWTLSLICLRYTESSIKEKLNRNTILRFSQSVVTLVRQWCAVGQDDGIYSAIVNANGNYGIREDIYMSVPLKFDSGEFFFIKNYKFSPQALSVVTDIILVIIYKFLKHINNKLNSNKSKHFLLGHKKENSHFI